MTARGLRLSLEQVSTKGECPTTFIITPEIQLSVRDQLQLGKGASEGKSELLTWVSDLQKVSVLSV